MGWSIQTLSCHTIVIKCIDQGFQSFDLRNGAFPFLVCPKGAARYTVTVPSPRDPPGPATCGTGIGYVHMASRINIENVNFQLFKFVIINNETMR